MKLKQVLRLFSCIFILGFLMLPFISGCNQVMESEKDKSETIELKIGFYQPPTHIFVTTAQDVFPKLEKLTDGRYKFKIFHTETLCKATEMLDFTNRGLCYGNLICNAYFTGSFPILAIDSVPIWTGGAKGVEKAYKGGLNNLITEYFHEKGLSNVEYVSATAFSARSVATKDKPIKQISDFKGLKMRTLGFERVMIEEGGGGCVAIKMPEVYEALQRGIIDGVIAQESNWWDWKLYEVVDYINHIDLTTTPMGIVINIPQTEKMSQQDREAVLQVLREYCNRLAEETYSYDAKVREFLKDEWEGEAFYPTAQEKKEWVEKVRDKAIQGYLEKSGTWGEKALEIVKKYNP